MEHPSIQRGPRQKNDSTCPVAPDAEQEGKNGQSQKILASEMGKKIEEPVPRSQKTEKRQRQGGAASALKEAEDVGPHLLSHELFSRNDEFSSVADHVGF